MLLRVSVPAPALVTAPVPVMMEKSVPWVILPDVRLKINVPLFTINLLLAMEPPSSMRRVPALMVVVPR